jgi:hypothetical protein
MNSPPAPRMPVAAGQNILNRVECGTICDRSVGINEIELRITYNFFMILGILVIIAAVFAAYGLFEAALGIWICPILSHNLYPAHCLYVI